MVSTTHKTLPGAMRQRLLYSVVAFLLGLCMGGFAFGQKGESTNVGQAVVESEPQRAARAATVVGTAGDETQTPVVASVADDAASEEGLQKEGPVSVDIGPMALDEQLQVMASRWATLESRFTQLSERVNSLERRVVTSESGLGDDRVEDEGGAIEVLPTDTAENRRVALIAAGVPDRDAEEIVFVQSALDMERLELQDRAIREGWHRTDRYFDELRVLSGEALDLPAEIGEEAYDRYLYQTGESNRLKVSSVIQGSPAEQTGLLPGDIIESYGGERIFTFTDLRNATTNGVRNELVPLMVRRGDTVIETSLARGPIGVRLEPAAVAPDS